MDHTLLKGLEYLADVASAALFRASDDSSWITGSVIPVDGGVHIKRYLDLLQYPEGKAPPLN